MRNQILALLALSILAGCSNSDSKTTAAPETKKADKPDSSQVSKPVVIADAPAILGRKQVPVLCYHHIRPIQMASKANRGYEVTVQQFKDQMKALADSGYKTILPEQY